MCERGITVPMKTLAQFENKKLVSTIMLEVIAILRSLMFCTPCGNYYNVMFSYSRMLYVAQNYQISQCFLVSIRIH